MPQLQAETQSQLKACLRRLEELPAAVAGEPTSYVLSLVTSFCRDVALHVDGDPDTAGLVQRNRLSYARFKRDIRASAPPFLPVQSVSTRGGKSEYSQFADMEDDSDDDDNEELLDLTASDDSPTDTRWITLSDVRRHIRKSMGKELPNNVPYGAKVSLIRDFQASWEIDSRKCFDEVMRAFSDALNSLIQNRFERYAGLKTHVEWVHFLRPVA